MACKLASLAIIVAFAFMIASSRAKILSRPIVIKGRVFCDNCLVGYETPDTTYIAGAEVEVVCKDRVSMGLRYTRRAVTDETGTYNIPINDNHENEVCEVSAVSSPMAACTKPSLTRRASRVSLSVNNGLSSFVRHANTVAFESDRPMEDCYKRLKPFLLGDPYN